MAKRFYNWHSALCIIWLLGISFGASAQTSAPFNNEWINFDQTYYKIKVAKTGLHRIPYNALSGSGVPTGQGSSYKMYYRGQEIPLYVTTEGSMNTADYIEFYGEKNDGALDTRLYLYPGWQPNPYVSMFSDTSAYFLTIDETGPNKRYTDTPNNLAGAPAKEQYFMFESVKQNVNTFYGGKPVRLGGINTNYADFEDGEGFVGSAIEAGANINYNIATKSVYTGATQPQDTVLFKARVLGQSNLFDLIPDHRIQVKVNGTQVVDYEFEGYTSQNLLFGFPVSQLTSPNTQLNFASPEELANDTDLLVNRNSVPFFTVTYPHSYDFNSSATYKFTIPNNAAKYLEITNFNGGTAPVLYDLTNQLRFLPDVDNASGQPVYRFHLPQATSGMATRTLFFSNTSTVFPSVAVTLVSQLTETHFTNYNLPENRGNYLIITNRALMQGDVNEVERYAQHRSSAAGGSYSVVVADIEELYDQFSWGIGKHPLSINNFLRFAVQTWATPPEYLLLLGKSVGYRDSYALNNPANYNRNLVPTFGHPASDMMLSSAYPAASFVNQLATGRVPANTPQEVAAYLNKVIEHDNLLNNPTCNPQDREWMKHAMHIAGGSNLSEAELFFNTLENYRHKFEAVHFGGEVVKTYRSFSANPVDAVDLGNFINEGLAVINFVGHGAGGYWQVDIQEPQAYQNFGKYPFIMASSCFVGDIHSYDIDPITGQPQTAMSEDYVLADNVGAIGFLATVSSGFPLYLDQFNSKLYDHFCKDNYNKPIGYCIQNTVADVFAASPNDAGPKLTCQEYTLVGDPAVVINSWSRPEYVLDPAGITFSPQQVTADVDTFTIHVALLNLGMAVADSFTLHVQRTFPDGSQAAYSKRFASTLFTDTLTIQIPTGDPAAVEGENNFSITVDYNNEIAEDCEDNNGAAKGLFIFSDLLIPIYPCNFSIVPEQTVTLKASTGQPILPELNYVMQIDTSELFTNPLATTYISSKAGVIEWQPEIDFIENTVYYWRAARQQENPDSNNWKGSSFIYLPGYDSGFNQSHYYQFAYNQLHRITLNADSRQFRFQTGQNTLTATNQYDNFGAANFSLNGTPLEPISYCTSVDECKGGIAIAAFKPDLTLEPMVSERISGSGCTGRGQFGNLHCSFDDRYVFEFNTSDAQQTDSLVNFLQNHIPNGYFVLALSLNQHRLQAFTPAQQAAMQAVFDGMGIPNLFDVPDAQAFIAFGQKNNPAFEGAQLLFGPTSSSNQLNLNKTINTRASSGTIATPAIGPATEWNAVQYNLYDFEGTDTLLVYGVQPGNPDALLQTMVPATATGQQYLAPAANDYAFLRLELKTTHVEEQAEPTQINHLRVLFTRAPEVALNYQHHFYFYADTLQEGEPLQLEFAVTNAEATPTDSLLVQYTIINSANQPTQLSVPPLPPIAAGQTVNATLTHNTSGLQGSNLLAIELNPNMAQPEKFRFNNLVYLPFFVKTDKINPYVDVTFDGRHITDGELVSAKPEIAVRFTDENRYLALNDTSDFEMYLVYPNELGVPAISSRLYFSNPMVAFTPATENNAQTGKNTATINLQPTLATDGLYELQVKGKDRSGNLFAASTYSIRFKVVNTPSVSNLLNYPNPFTSSTRFVFTLTGTEVPQFMNIQIMTVSGRVVREISAAELGPIHIGNNLTEFAWDGTDQFGNPLGNGLYLYRFVSKLNGQTLQHYTTGADAYLKNGLGKMYLMR
ncbi:hypothetical protein C7N43_11190 [Sphingobacteriales bacterium UPWRP_1]|nr:hypothetical protein B6N25_13205 [Sphingobacteriales bacterium TSM_CSS]PSJ76915.1 hypothetical protein C7N43_11190 [Sphingobacteriales bacterium UPWRP_1]